MSPKPDEEPSVCWEKRGEATKGRMCYDIRKAKDQLGYEPHCATQAAIEETACWAAARA